MKKSEDFNEFIELLKEFNGYNNFPEFYTIQEDLLLTYDKNCPYCHGTGTAEMTCLNDTKIFYQNCPFCGKIKYCSWRLLPYIEDKYNFENINNFLIETLIEKEFPYDIFIKINIQNEMERKSLMVYSYNREKHKYELVENYLIKDFNEEYVKKWKTGKDFLSKYVFVSKELAEKYVEELNKKDG